MSKTAPRIKALALTSISTGTLILNMSESEILKGFVIFPMQAPSGSKMLNASSLLQEQEQIHFQAQQQSTQ